MGVLFGFGGMELRQSCIGNYFGEGYGNIVIIKGGGDGQAFFVFGHADIIEVAQGGATKAIEIGHHKCAGDLAHAVCPEVERNNRIVGLDNRHGVAIGIDDDGGLDKFVGDIGVV